MDNFKLRYARLEVRAFVHDTVTDTTAILFYDAHCPKRLFLAFRGTNSPTNAKTDVQAWQTRVKLGDSEFSSANCRLHSGFLKAYNAVRDKVRAAVYDAASSNVNTPGDVTLCICGHSEFIHCLFAVCAADSAHWFSLNCCCVRVDVVTFGQPRVGDKTFAVHLNSVVTSYIRFVVEGDPFSDTPSTMSALALSLVSCRLSMCPQYKHAGYELILPLESQGDIIADPSMAERLFVLKFRHHPRSHSMRRYHDSLLACVYHLRGEDEERHSSRPVRLLAAAIPDISLLPARERLRDAMDEFEIEEDGKLTNQCSKTIARLREILVDTEDLKHN